MVKNKALVSGLLALFILAGFLSAKGVPLSYAATNWEAKYWNNRSLSGDPVVVRQAPLQASPATGFPRAGNKPSM